MCRYAVDVPLTADGLYTQAMVNLPALLLGGSRVALFAGGLRGRMAAILEIPGKADRQVAEQEALDALIVEMGIADRHRIAEEHALAQHAACRGPLAERFQILRVPAVAHDDVHRSLKVRR